MEMIGWQSGGRKRGIILAILTLLTGCAGRKPPALPVIAKCGQMPAPVVDCIATLPPSATHADKVQCIAESRKLWRLDAELLRRQYLPCSGPAQ